MNEAEAAQKGSGRELGIPNARVDQDSLFIYDTADGSWTVGASQRAAALLSFPLTFSYTAEKSS